MDIKQVLGKRIKEIRKTKGLTQECVAEFVGIETKSFSNIECGRTYPESENLNKIMEILEVAPFDLFNYEYLKPHDELLAEMNSAMENDENLTRLIYRVFKAVK